MLLPTVLRNLTLFVFRFLILANILSVFVLTEAQAIEKNDLSKKNDEETTSGLPVPRFVSLKFEEVNVRTGPGTRYPIRWIYKRKNMPVEIIEEFGDWRKLRDVVGDEGWSHKNQLSGARHVLMREDIVLRRYADDDAPPMLKARKHVTARLLECDKQWCEVQVQSYKAWVLKKKLWGIYPQETYKND